jgi:hypothetical protein
MAKPGPKTQRLFDEKGLYLEVSPTGGKWWRLKYRIGGKEKRLSLGTYPDTPLKLARERRDEARQLLASGIDPSDQRQQDKRRTELEAANSFRHVALAWMQHRAEAWAPLTREKVAASLEAVVFPVFGALPIGELRARHVLQAVRQVETRGAGETAARVLQRIRAVCRYAVIEELIETNPTLDVKPEEVLKPRTVTHRAAMPEAELPAFLARLDAYEGEPSTVQRAVQILEDARLVVMTSEVRQGRAA